MIIATENATIGMGGPAMIEGGGLGQFAPEEVGPVSVQVPNGVIDVLVADEADATRVARQYLSYSRARCKRGRVLTRLCCVVSCRRIGCRSTMRGVLSQPWPIPGRFWSDGRASARG